MRNIANSLVHEQFFKRWSPRAFDDCPLAENEIASLFEAARWAPSCFNEQPWRFVYVTSGMARAKLNAALNEANVIWAEKAPLLVVVASQKRFTRNQKENQWHQFDAGAAWMSLALQAHYLGLVSHAMGGFNAQAVSDVCDIDLQAFSILCVVAVGRQAAVASLPAVLQEREVPSERQSLGKIAYKDKMP